MPKISVIVPVYKVEQYLSRCVDSILNQTYKDFELILVDDGSPDDSPRICDEYAAKYDNIVVIHKENGGLSDARNKGVDWAFENSDSEYITFIDSDDCISPFYLEYLHQAVNENPASVAVCSYKTFSDADVLDDSCSEYSADQMETEAFFCNNRVNAVIACGKLYHKADFAEVRYPCGKLHEDEYTTYKVLFPYKTVSFVAIPLYFYFDNTTGITKSNWSIKRLDATQAYKNQLSFFKENNYVEAYNSTLYAIITTELKSLVNLREFYPKEKKLISSIKREVKRYVKEYSSVTVISDELNKQIFKTLHPRKFALRKYIRKKFSYLKEVLHIS